MSSCFRKWKINFSIANIYGSKEFTERDVKSEYFLPNGKKNIDDKIEFYTSLLILFNVLKKALNCT